MLNCKRSGCVAATGTQSGETWEELNLTAPIFRLGWGRGCADQLWKVFVFWLFWCVVLSLSCLWSEMSLCKPLSWVLVAMVEKVILLREPDRIAWPSPFVVSFIEKFCFSLILSATWVQHAAAKTLCLRKQSVAKQSVCECECLFRERFLRAARLFYGRALFRIFSFWQISFTGKHTTLSQSTGVGNTNHQFIVSLRVPLSQWS